MKKVLLFLGLFLMGLSKVKSYDFSEVFYYDEKVPNMYVTKVKGSNQRNGATFLLHKSDSKLVYCLDPFTREIDGEYEGYIGYNDLFGLSLDQVNKINLISYYGYGYPGHEDIKWYGITQYLIWQELGLDDIYFTDSYYGNRVDMYQSEIYEITNLVNNHFILPNFDIDLNNLSIKKEYVLNDINNVLNLYEVIYDQDLNVVKEDNKLIIKIEKEGTYHIKLIKKSKVLNDYYMYYHPSSQNMFYPGKYNDIENDLVLNFYSGEINIQKEDRDSREIIGETSFENAIYGLYDEIDNLIKEVSLDKKGYGNINNLELKKYYLKEIKPSKGYLIDDTKYYINLDSNNRLYYITVLEDVIKNKFKIKKLYGNNITNNYKVESDVSFNLYDMNNNLLKTFITDKLGEISLELPYGNYVLKQVSGMDNYSISEPIFLKIEKENDYQELLIKDNEEIKKGNLKIKKIGDDGKLLDGTKFKLFAKEDIVSLSGDIYYHKDDYIDEIIINDGYGYLNDLYYGKYYLVETETMYNYLLNDTPIDVEINDSDINIEVVNEYYNIPNTGKNDIDYKNILSNIIIILGSTMFIYEIKKIYINN